MRPAAETSFPAPPPTAAVVGQAGSLHHQAALSRRVEQMLSNRGFRPGVFENCFLSLSMSTCTAFVNDKDHENRAFEGFQELYDVGAILDPDDPQCCADEKANITYLAELMHALPKLEDGEKGGQRRSIGGGFGLESLKARLPHLSPAMGQALIQTLCIVAAQRTSDHEEQECVCVGASV